MADWPDADELKRVLNVDSDAWDTTLDRVLSAAIRRVQKDVGAWAEEVDTPSDNLSQAALRMAELISERPDATPGSKAWSALSADPTYQTLLYGSRRVFGIG